MSFRDAMNELAAQPGTLFLGQGVACAGTRMSESFTDVPAEQKIEMPVAEALQLGLSIGLALEGFTPVSVFPRWNFLLCAADMLVNGLDALPLYSAYRPRVIIRTAVGCRLPLDPGPQHDGDFTAAFGLMLRTVRLRRASPRTAVEVYRAARAHDGATLVTEDE